MACLLAFAVVNVSRSALSGLYLDKAQRSAHHHHRRRRHHRYHFHHHYYRRRRLHCRVINMIVKFMMILSVSSLTPVLFCYAVCFNQARLTTELAVQTKQGNYFM